MYLLRFRYITTIVYKINRFLSTCYTIDNELLTKVIALVSLNRVKTAIRNQIPSDLSTTFVSRVDLEAKSV